MFDPHVNVSQSELRDRASAENTEVVVYNNTDIPGLAGQTRDWLIGQGVAIPSLRQTSEPGNTPTIMHRTPARYGRRVIWRRCWACPPEPHTGQRWPDQRDMMVLGSDMPQILKTHRRVS